MAKPLSHRAFARIIAQRRRKGSRLAVVGQLLRAVAARRAGRDRQAGERHMPVDIERQLLPAERQLALNFIRDRKRKR